MSLNQRNGLFRTYFILAFWILSEACATHDLNDEEACLVSSLNYYPQSKPQKTRSVKSQQRDELPLIPSEKTKIKAEPVELNSLPAEVTFNVLGFLPELELLNVRSVSKPLHRIATESFAKYYAREFYGINKYNPYFSWYEQSIVKHLRVHFEDLHELAFIKKAGPTSFEMQWVRYRLQAQLWQGRSIEATLKSRIKYLKFLKQKGKLQEDQAFCNNLLKQELIRLKVRKVDSYREKLLYAKLFMYGGRLEEGMHSLLRLGLGNDVYAYIKKDPWFSYFYYKYDLGLTETASNEWEEEKSVFLEDYAGLLSTDSYLNEDILVNSLKAQYRLARIDEVGKRGRKRYEFEALERYKKTINHVRSLSRKNASLKNIYVKSLYYLGLMYFEGRALEGINLEAAFEYFQEAAQQGYTKAQYMLGQMYYLGSNIPQAHRSNNYNWAFHWWGHAAEKAHTDALFCIGWMYEKGYGARPWMVTARSYYRKAALKGNKSAQVKLGIAAKFDSEDQAVLSRWVGLSHKSENTNIENRDKEVIEIANLMQGYFHELGLYTKQNTAKALEYYKASEREACVYGIARLLPYCFINKLKLKKIKDEQIKVLGDALKANTTLTTLSLRNYPSSVKGDLVGMMPEEELAAWTTPKEELITLEGIRILSQALQHNTSLRTLDLRGNQIEEEGMRVLTGVLKHNATLTNLYLSNNEIGREGMKMSTRVPGYYERWIKRSSMFAELLHPYSILQTLDLKGNKIWAMGVKMMCEALKNNSTLTILKLQGNKIGNRGAKEMANALQANITLTHLHLSDNEIGDKGVRELSNSLKNNPTLNLLALGKNCITDEGGKTLGEALQHNTSLTKLDLHDNQIKKRGGIALVGSLKINSSLRKLKLGNNQIGKGIGKSLASTLMINKTLTTLCLKNNNISDIGATRLAKALDRNNTLTSLDLRNNNFEKEGGIALNLLRMNNTTLKSLKLDETSSLQIRKPSLRETLSQIEEVIQIYTSKERDTSLSASVHLNHKDIPAFLKAFHKLVENLPASFSWSTINKGPISPDHEESDWSIMLSLSCDAKYRRQVEHEFVYKVSKEDKEKVNWPLVYELVRRGGLSHHFKFDNSIKISLLKLESASEEENLDEIIQFLETKLPKDTNLFHIIGIELNKAADIRADQLAGSFFSKVSYKDIAFVKGRNIFDAENNVLYLCLRNSNRQILDLRGKQDKHTKRYEGRSAEQGREETISFILRAYENFQEDVTLVTGRGTHDHANGQKGRLYKAFSKKWINDDMLKPIIKIFQPLEGGEEYNIKFLKIKKLELGNVDIEDAVSRLKQEIKLRVPKPQSRLLLKMSSGDNETTGNKAYNVFDQFIHDLYANDQKLYKLLIPISFEAKKGELRLIFNKQHSRAPNSESFGDYSGTSVIEGTRGRLEN
ncbi:MAG: SEL1-like repeat protein [Alphaproteobacteria bacterium]|nr:SEL1-like repeat protein [Alphaproteobacteria bacterium]